jgi:hypothetical protein
MSSAQNAPTPFPTDQAGLLRLTESEQNIQRFLVMLAAIISWVSDLLVLLLLLKFRDQCHIEHDATLQVLRCYVVADLINCLGFFPLGLFSATSPAVCLAQGFLLQLGSVVILWNMTLSFIVIYFAVLNRTVYPYMLGAAHALNWGLALITSSIAVAQDWYGSVGPWCWVRRSDLWWVLWYGPLFLAFGFNLVAFSLVTWRARAAARTEVAAKGGLQSSVGIGARCGFIVFTFLATWIPITLHRFVFQNLALSMVVAFMTPLSGFWILLGLSPDVTRMFVLMLSNTSRRKQTHRPDLPEDRRPLKANEAVVLHEPPPPLGGNFVPSEASEPALAQHGYHGVPILRSAQREAVTVPSTSPLRSVTKSVRGKKVRVYQYGQYGTQLRGSARAYDNAFEMSQASVLQYEASLARREKESQSQTGAC